ncbi:MAG: hypothetical protein ACI85I_001620 [Arenicella sp.]|jgi:hypothetical protein
MKKTYREEGDKIIKGISLPVFIHNMNYHLTNINVYEDGMIDCWELVDLNGFKEKIKSGWVKTQLPKGENVSAFPLGNFEVRNFYPNRTETELVKEVEHIINKFKGKKTLGDICSIKFETFKNNPNQRTKENLKIAYENMPEHKRRFLLGDMDVDDIPIRAVIYGDIVFQESDKAKLSENLIKKHYLRGIKIEKTATKRSSNTIVEESVNHKKSYKSSFWFNLKSWWS